MRSAFCLATLLSCALAGSGQAQSTPTANDLLGDVIARLPPEPLLITGDITHKKRKGFVERTLTFDMAVHWGANPSVACYTVRNALGTELEQLTVLRMQGGQPLFRYAAGSPLEDADTPDLFAPIQDTDISWMDLTLSFLWWPDGRIVDTDTIKGYDCYVVEVPAPDSVPGQYAKVRVWIAKKIHMLLQATGYDHNGDPVRRLWVKSFKKIDEQWMVKDLLVQGRSDLHRTELRIRDVEAHAGHRRAQGTTKTEGDTFSSSTGE